MTQEEQIRLYRLMEKLNWFFHQEMHYLNRDIAEKTARECYPEISGFYIRHFMERPAQRDPGAAHGRGGIPYEYADLLF